MRTYYSLIITCLFMPIIGLAEKTVYILIHGTWSHQSLWYTAEGDFFDTLEKTINSDDAVVPFTWSGRNNHQARLLAAKNLAKLIQSYPLSTRLVLIAHSHGGNLINLASQILMNTSKHILHEVITLGTPVNMNSLYPNMSVIKHLYQLFSLNDHVQPVFGYYQREFDTNKHERITNIRLKINGVEPNHSNMHNQLIAQWIPQLASRYKQFICNQKTLSSSNISVIWQLLDDKEPYFKQDLLRKRRIKADQEQNKRFAKIFTNLCRHEGYRLVYKPKKILKSIYFS